MSTTTADHRVWHRAVREFVAEFDWIHTTLGLIGNLSFFVGSVFFLWESLKTAGVWLFIVGAFGMLIGSVGSAMVKLETKDDGQV